MNTEPSPSPKPVDPASSSMHTFTVVDPKESGRHELPAGHSSELAQSCSASPPAVPPVGHGLIVHELVADVTPSIPQQRSPPSQSEIDWHKKEVEPASSGTSGAEPLELPEELPEDEPPPSSADSWSLLDDLDPQAAARARAAVADARTAHCFIATSHGPCRVPPTVSGRGGGPCLSSA
jgi:hypothetical protein